MSTGVERITAWLGDVRIGSLRAEQVATWQSELLRSLAVETVADTRATFRSVLDEAVNLALASADDRLGATVALLFVPGWRVWSKSTSSEVVAGVGEIEALVGEGEVGDDRVGEGDGEGGPVEE